MKLAIGDELQTLFHPIVNATKQVAEETRKELAPMKKYRWSLICDKSHVDYSCKDGNVRYTGCSQESRSTLDCAYLVLLLTTT